jgi:Skp family chaperone for outer membrane proteins
MKELVAILIACSMSALIGGLVYSQIPKTGYVDSEQLFEAFDGKQELEAKLDQASNQRKQTIDSVKLRIQSLTLGGIKEEQKKEIYLLQQEYQQRNKEYQEFYSYQSTKYTESIWKQISQYTKEYGIENNYDYIHGIAGTGSLMYGKPEKDLTKEVIDYINQKYAGN